MIGGHFRPRRMEMFVRLLGITPSTTVLDVGGSAVNWGFCAAQPRITILNTDKDIHVNGFPFVCGDATSMPFGDGQFDVIFSNSVIEHAERRLWNLGINLLARKKRGMAKPAALPARRTP